MLAIYLLALKCISLDKVLRNVISGLQSMVLKWPFFLRRCKVSLSSGRGGHYRSSPDVPALLISLSVLCGRPYVLANGLRAEGT